MHPGVPELRCGLSDPRDGYLRYLFFRQKPEGEEEGDEEGRGAAA
jgi:hypothetical protein